VKHVIGGDASERHVYSRYVIFISDRINIRMETDERYGEWTGY